MGSSEPLQGKDVEGTLKHVLDEARAVKLCIAAILIENWTDIKVSFRTLRTGPLRFLTSTSTLRFEC